MHSPYTATGRCSSIIRQSPPFQTITQGTAVGIATDFAAGHVWFTTNGSTWNNAIIGLQNPVGNIGGIAISITGSALPIYQVLDTPAVCQYTADFGATTFAYSTLFAALQAAGYTSFDSSSDTLMGRAVM